MARSVPFASLWLFQVLRQGDVWLDEEAGEDEARGGAEVDPKLRAGLQEDHTLRRLPQGINNTVSCTAVFKIMSEHSGWPKFERLFTEKIVQCIG